MIKEIKYNGFTETPSDYECPDGDLATVTGLVPEDESLHPVQPPVPLFVLPQGYTVACIHQNTGYKHYIIRHNYDEESGEPPVSQHISDFYWIDPPAQGAVITADRFTDDNRIIKLTDRTVYDINSIGNTLLLLTDEGIHYQLWKGENSKYLDLGTHLPELDLSFGLQGERVKYEDEGLFRVGFEEVGIDEFFGYIESSTHDYTYPFDNDDQDEATPSALAAVNKFIAEKSVGDGKFLFPFLVRYAYRLYDQSLVMHSAPVLMTCATELPLQCFVKNYEQGGDLFSDTLDTAVCYIEGILHQLNYMMVDGRQKTQLQYWADIVESVDVFISAPIYTYDQSGKVTGITERPWSSSTRMADFSITKFKDENTDPARENADAWKVTYQEMYNPVGAWRTRLLLPTHDSQYVIDSIKDCHNFYFLKSIDIDELATERTVITVAKEYLASLTNREAMTDDYDSHDNLMPRYSFTYNSRLNIANLSKQLFAGQSPQVLFCHSGGATEDLDEYELEVYIKEDNKEIVVQAGTDSGTATIEYNPLTASYNNATPLLYLYFPNTNAYKAVLTKRGEPATYYEVVLKKHPFLNGAFFFDGWAGVNDIEESGHAYGGTRAVAAPTVSPDSDRIVRLPNKLYTSEVNNPFVFMPSGINTIGVSEIIGIRPIVEAVSPAQYGIYSFYVFALDGVWAMKVSTEGYLEAPHLVTPDIVLGNGESITQIDGAVLFATDRGIMMVSGSKSICISDMLYSQSPFTPLPANPADDPLPQLRAILSTLGLADNLQQTLDIRPFRTFIQGCRMLYDYPHQRIIIYNPAMTYAYIYSIKSKLWGIIPSEIRQTVIDAPLATAMIEVEMEEDQQGESVIVQTLALADYSQDPAPSGSATVPSGLIITRPLKLDMPDVLKTIDTVIQRGKFRKGNIQSILYGSRDLYNWQLVWSSTDHYLRGFRGTPYKYFRIALVCQLGQDESLWGCTVQLTPRYTNKPR